MKRIAMTFVLAVFVLMQSHAVWAAKIKDKVSYQDPAKKKGDDVEGTIENESPAGVKLKPDKGEARLIPAQQITSIVYGVGADVVGAAEFRKPDGRLTNALKEPKADKKAEALSLALSAFSKLDGDPMLNRSAPVHRYLQFRIAQILYLQAVEDARQRDGAIAALVDYKKNFGDGWEIVLALEWLALLQQDKGDVEGASQSFAELADLPGILPPMKLKNQLRGARLLMRAGKFAEAKTTLEKVEATMSSDDPQRASVGVFLIQSRIAQKSNLDGIDTKLSEIIRSSKDGNLLPLAHNALGDYYREKNNKDQAFWEYCKVDVLYNQDKEEHAKALYYLSQLYDRPRNDNERAKECLTRLKTSAFDGTLYQRLAKAEKKTGE